jgi:hypothetical protein
MSKYAWTYGLIQILISFCLEIIRRTYVRSKIKPRIASKESSMGCPKLHAKLASIDKRMLKEASRLIDNANRILGIGFSDGDTKRLSPVQ